MGDNAKVVLEVNGIRIPVKEIKFVKRGKHDKDPVIKTGDVFHFDYETVKVK